MSVFVTCTVFFHYIFMTNTLIAGVSTLTSRKRLTPGVRPATGYPIFCFICRFVYSGIKIFVSSLLRIIYLLIVTMVLDKATNLKRYAQSLLGFSDPRMALY